LWGYQDYHSIHHLFPKVPFYRYRRLFNEIADRMDQMGAPVYRLTWAAPH
jgi:beta-carotene hydroxylase